MSRKPNSDNSKLMERRTQQQSFLKSNTLLIGSSSPTSSYHQQCIPKEAKTRVSSAPPRTCHPKEYELCNQVAQERIWNERVVKERNLQKNWETNLGFLTEYDQYGNKKEKKEIPKSVPSIYSALRQRPLTASREYGYRVQSAPSRQMQSLEQQTRRGMKRNKDICYTY